MFLDWIRKRRWTCIEDSRLEAFKQFLIAVFDIAIDRFLLSGSVLTSSFDIHVILQELGHSEATELLGWNNL